MCICVMCVWGLCVDLCEFVLSVCVCDGCVLCGVWRVMFVVCGVCMCVWCRVVCLLYGMCVRWVLCVWWVCVCGVCVMCVFVRECVICVMCVFVGWVCVWCTCVWCVCVVWLCVVLCVECGEGVFACL